MRTSQLLHIIYKYLDMIWSWNTYDTKNPKFLSPVTEKILWKALCVKHTQVT